MIVETSKQNRNPSDQRSSKTWRDCLPPHWGLRRLRTVVEMRVSNVDKHTNEDEMPVRLCNYVDVYYNDRIDGTLPYMQATVSPSEADRFRLKQNDVLITKDSEAWNDIAVPALVTDAPNDLICGYHLAILRPSGMIDGAFLARVLQTQSIAHQFHVEAQGITRYGLTHDDILSASVPLPPLEEQATIVRFLDHADELINRYISAKERLIALLEEQRHAETALAMASSTSRHIRLEVVADAVPKPIQRTATSEYTPIGLFNRGRGAFIKDTVKGSELGDSDFFWISEGDLIISGQFAWEGAIALANPELQGCVASHRFPILRGKPSEMKTEFLFALLRTDQGQMLLDTNSRGAAGRNRPLNARTLLKETIAVPPMDVQSRIAELVMTEHQLRKQASLSQELLGEYRVRLISDVVTGQIDVRDAAIDLPN